MNLRRPRWRCPHCDQYVCYLDIRVDQNMVKASSSLFGFSWNYFLDRVWFFMFLSIVSPHMKMSVDFLSQVLREVGENVSQVIISVDGSWKAVLENDDDLDLAETLKETSEQDEATPRPSIVDLTNDDDTEMDTASACESEDVKPLSNTNNAQVADDFWSGVLFANGLFTSSTELGNCIPHSGPNSLQPSVLSDAVSLALNREAGSHGNTDLLVSAIYNQFSTPNNVNSQQFQSANLIASNEYGISQTLPRDLASGLPIVRNPVAVQALPAQSQTLGVQQRPRTSFNNLATTGAFFTSQDGQSITPPANVLDAVCSDLERQQHFCRPRMNPVQVSDIASSSLHHGSITTQVGASLVSQFSYALI